MPCARHHQWRCDAPGLTAIHSGIAADLDVQKNAAAVGGSIRQRVRDTEDKTIYAGRRHLPR